MAKRMAHKPRSVRAFLRSNLSSLEKGIIAYVREQAKARAKLRVKKDHVFGMLAEGFPLDAIVRVMKLPLETILMWQNEWERIYKAS